EAENGLEFTERLSTKNHPDIVRLDINMPIMDAIETAKWLEQRYPEIKVLVLTMHNDDKTILQMLNAGVNGYVLKNADPSELLLALQTLDNAGCYFPGALSRILSTKTNSKQVEISDRETEFL